MNFLARTNVMRRNHKNKGEDMSTLKTAAIKYRLTLHETENLTNEVFVKVMHLYKDAYGYIPNEWIKELRIREARLRFTNLLVNDGYVREDLETWSIVQLRDECESNKLVLVGNKAA